MPITYFGPGFLQVNQTGGSLAVGGAISGATAGSVLFADGSGNLGQDNANLYWDDTNNCLNIGASARLGTTERLYVSHASGVGLRLKSSGSVSYIQLHSSTSGTTDLDGLSIGINGVNCYVLSRESGELGLGINGAPRWAVNASGHWVAVTDNSYDIGLSTSVRPRNVYIAGDVQIAAGAYKTSSAGIANSQIAISGNSLAHTVIASQAVDGYVFNSTGARTSGANSFFKITPVANTGQTASTEINGFTYDAYTKQWETGALTNQREFVVNAPTYAFVAASTITNAATLYVSGAPIAGTNATITNQYSIWTGGGTIRYDGSGVALGGGSTATLGTIGGSGPATAGQNKWAKINIDGTNYWIPVWV